MESKRVLIDIKRLNREGGTQHWPSIDDEVVAGYTDAMLDGDEFPPVEAVHDGKTYWLWDGFKRTLAALGAGKAAIAVNIKKGTQRDAFLLSLSANSKHGQARTNAVKKAAVTAALMDEVLAEESSRELARICGVSHTFVDSIRVPKERTVKPPAEPAKVATVATDQPPPEGKPEAGEVATVATGTAGHDADPADVKVTRPGVVPKGSVEAITAERDALRDQVAELAPLLQEQMARTAELEAGADLGDVERALKEENVKLRELLRVADETIRGLTNEKNEAIKLAKKWQAKATK